MKLLITKEELNNKKSRELVPMECEFCKNTFYKEQHFAIAVLNGENKQRLRYCSQSCASKNQLHPSNKIEKQCKYCNKPLYLVHSRVLENNFCSRKCNAIYYSQFKKKPKINKPKRVWAKIINLNCSFCHKEIRRREYQFKQSKSKTFFCCKSCKTKYANQYQIIHKPKSRAEILLVSLIKNDFPNLNIQENIRNILPSKLEIDIFIPDLKLAIELNGPVHYIPIYGQERLDKVKNKDLLKQTEIQQLGLNLIIIDISQLNSRQSTDNFINEYFNKYIEPIIISKMVRREASAASTSECKSEMILISPAPH